MNITLRLLTIVLCLVSIPVGFEVREADAVDLTPVDQVSHIHGLAVEPRDSDILYIATHFGLIRAVNGKSLALIGKEQNDYMGFSMSADGKTFFVSGHQQPDGRNMGLRRSDDGGQTWEKIAFDGQVDFHAMTVSLAKPGIIYGWYGRVFQSLDGGKNWKFSLGSGLPTASEPGPYSPIRTLAADPSKVDRVWAGTDQGLYVSNNGGQQWNRIDTLPAVPVTAFAVDPKRGQTLYLFSPVEGMFSSRDEGKSWRRIGRGIGDKEVVGYFAIDSIRPSIVYAATFHGAVYRSQDSGNTWTPFISSVR